ncbi:hypothetical protein [uncultured Polaribacter sp.]|uniref:hypothetical protein n=1 Tax=uncultured Polaribacter sp. TaxID=174711 RepID=UPI00261DB429|nr:hypothetical protein [uncultured Polaribacter sp.]
MVKLKLILLILFLTFGFEIFCQNSIDLSIHQDTKFIFVGDDRGNHRGTLDIIIKLEVPLKRFSKSQISIFPLFEHAALHSGSLQRYAIGASYVYKDFFIKKINLGLYPNYGFITRFNDTNSSAGIDIDISYRLTKRVSISYVHQIIERTDLKTTYNESDYIRNSSFLGFKVHF